MVDKAKGIWDWQKTEDGVLWMQCEVAGGSCVVALVPNCAGQISATVIVELNIARSASFDAAKRAVEDWLSAANSAPAVEAPSRRSRTSSRD